MAAPTLAPHQRDDIVGAGSYRRSDPVWVYRGGNWRPGVVESSSAQAALVTYRPTPASGTAVDTLTAPYIVGRDDEDTALDQKPQLDRPIPRAVDAQHAPAGDLYPAPALPRSLPA
jgi:hypothetical protein